MIQWLINVLLSWYAGPTAQKLIAAGIDDLVSTGKDLGAAALLYVKEANEKGMENKFQYVQDKMLEKFETVGKSKINTAIELAVSALSSGLTK
jgi:hypothetical protein